MFEFLYTQAIGIAAGVVGGMLIGSGAVLLCLVLHKVLMFFGEE